MKEKERERPEAEENQSSSTTEGRVGVAMEQQRAASNESK